MIVADASPLIHLARIGRLALLERLYGSVVVPRTVWAEVARVSASHPEASALERASEAWLEVRDLSRREEKASEALGRRARLAAGEREAIVLADALRVPFATDDALAVRVARSRGLETRWTTAIIAEAFRRGILDRGAARDAVEDLVHSGLWISPTILVRILAALEEA